MAENFAKREVATEYLVKFVPLVILKEKNQ